MAIWSDEITLIGLKEPEERVNSNGFANPMIETKSTVFCNEKSIGYSEYFKSEQAGITLDAKVEVHSVDYDNQKIAIFNGKRCSILKTYKINDDVIELTLSDLREQAESEV